MKKNTLLIVLLCSIILSLNAFGQSEEASAEDLAKQLANPVAALISVPLQSNFDFYSDPNSGMRYTLNVQPVIPISIGKNWNIISRTILPIISQSSGDDDPNESGLGDIVQSVFFSPKQATKDGLVWGIGPVFLLPTGSEAFGLNKFAVGPNALVLKLSGPWTYGALVNHMWSVAGSGYVDLNTSFFQPFATYATPSGSSYTLASENTQSWNSKYFSGFVGVYYAKVLKLKTQMFQLGGGPKLFYGNTDTGADWGMRVNLILLFPK